MVQYLPWSERTLHECIQESQNGEIPVIDLELTAKCSAAHCIYCDSMPVVCPNPIGAELPLEDTLHIMEQAVKKGLKWIYTCGLGEPLEDKRFFPLLDFIKHNDVKLSIFTNGQFIRSVEIAKRLKESNVNIILKMDTFDENKFDHILGGTGRAKRIYNAIDYLLEVGYTDVGEDGYTDLAFSIVPTQLTRDTIPQVVKFCFDHNIFPSVGELEQAGNVVNLNLFASLGLSEKNLNDIKLSAELAQIGYMRPICPAILCGLHIDNKGNCIVDTVTGLNCKWFLLKDPHTTAIGNICDCSIDELAVKVKKYREYCWEKNRKEIDEYETISYTFGGCGGNPAQVISLYKEINGIR